MNKTRNEYESHLEQLNNETRKLKVERDHQVKLIKQLRDDRNEWRELVGRIRMLVSLRTDDQSKQFLKEIDGQRAGIKARGKKRRSKKT